MVDMKSDANGGMQRTITVYTADGKELATYKGKIDIETNENCECDPDKCSKAVDITMFSDLPFRKFICGRDKCKYCK